MVRPKDHDLLSDNEDSDDSSGCCGCDSDDDDGSDISGGGVKFVTKVFEDGKGNVQFIRMPKGDDDEGGGKEKLDKVAAKGEDAPAETGDESSKAKPVPEFSDEEYLIASPVVLGFAFAEKLWLEFTVSGIKEIQWNVTAYESLVLEPKTKDIVKVSRIAVVSLWQDMANGLLSGAR
jgi:hypothetical protein